MKHWLLAVAFICFGSSVFAQPVVSPALSPKADSHPYFKVLGFGAPFWKSLGFDISPRSPLNTAGVASIGVVTHSTADGSLCRTLDLGSWCVPESWVPVQITFGGSLTSQAYLGAGSSFNLAPQVGALIFSGVSTQSSGWAQAVKTAFLAEDPSKGQVRLGVDFIGSIVQPYAPDAYGPQGSRFVSLKEAYPGRGPLRILGNAARLNVGWAW
jgi:hypothetical protein